MVTIDDNKIFREAADPGKINAELFKNSTLELELFTLIITVIIGCINREPSLKEWKISISNP